MALSVISVQFTHDDDHMINAFKILLLMKKMEMRFDIDVFDFAVLELWFLVIGTLHCFCANYDL